MFYTHDHQQNKEGLKILLYLPSSHYIINK